MKKILLLVFMALPFVFTACSDDDDDDTTYEFKWEFEDSKSVTFTVSLLEYNNQDEKVNTSSFEAYEGLVSKITATENAEKVKVYIKMEGKYGSPTYRWVQQVYYLNKGGNKEITITESTLLGSDEP